MVVVVLQGGARARHPRRCSTSARSGSRTSRCRATSASSRSSRRTTPSGSRSTSCAAEGVTPDTWDREEHGYVVTR